MQLCAYAPVHKPMCNVSAIYLQRYCVALHNYYQRSLPLHTACVQRRPVRRRHSVGGDAPVILVGSGGAPPVPKSRRRRGAGGQKNFFQRFPKKFVRMTSFILLVIEQNCNKITTQQQWPRRHVDKLSAAARRSTKVGGGTHKLSAA